MAKAKPETKHQCQVQDILRCRRDKCVRRYQGTKKGDPKFYACWACAMMFKRLKEIK
jgi:hypothetical protein